MDKTLEQQLADQKEELRLSRELVKIAERDLVIGDDFEALGIALESAANRARQVSFILWTIEQKDKK